MFAVEIGLLQARYEELRIQLHQKDAELLRKDILGKEQLRSMLQSLEQNLSLKIDSLSTEIDDSKKVPLKAEEQFTLLAKQINVLTSKIESAPEEILKLWAEVEAGKVGIDNLGLEVTKHFARLENLEKRYEEDRLEQERINAEQERFKAEVRAALERKASIKGLVLEEELIDAAVKFYNVTESSPNFVGRSAELSQIKEYFDNNVAAMQVIGAMGGMGKTQLALEYADSNKKFYNGKVRWIVAENRSVLDTSMREFARDLKIDTQKLELEEVISKIKQYLSSSNSKAKAKNILDNTLLIFDNVEEAGVIDLIKDLFPVARGRDKVESEGEGANHVLITTRSIRDWELKAAQQGGSIKGSNNKLNVLRLEPLAKKIKLLN